MVIFWGTGRLGLQYMNWGGVWYTIQSITLFMIPQALPPSTSWLSIQVTLEATCWRRPKLHLTGSHNDCVGRETLLTWTLPGPLRVKKMNSYIRKKQIPIRLSFYTFLDLYVKALVGSHWYKGKCIFWHLPKINQSGMVIYAEGSEGSHNTLSFPALSHRLHQFPNVL